MLQQLLVNLQHDCFSTNGFVGEQIGGELTVVRVNPAILARKSYSHVKPGYKILRLNEINCRTWDNYKAAQYLSSNIVENAEFRNMTTKSARVTTIAPSGVMHSYTTRIEQVEQVVPPSRTPSRIPFRTLDFKWNQPCEFGCGYIHLNVANASEKDACCKGGRFLREDDVLGDFSRLLPLNGKIENLIMMNMKHFAQNSAALNNLFCIGTYCNDKKSGTGLQRILGDHSVTLNGRFHHYLPSMSKKDPSGGIACFTMDQHTGEALESLRRHAEKINSFFTAKARRPFESDVEPDYPLPIRETEENFESCHCVRSSSTLCSVCVGTTDSCAMDPVFVHRPAAVDVVDSEEEDNEFERAYNFVLSLPICLSSTDDDRGSTVGLDTVVFENRLNLRIIELLYHYLTAVNTFCIELKSIGETIRRHTNSRNIPALRAELNNRVQFLEVGHIRSLQGCEDYVLMLNNSTCINNCSAFLEPLCYPLLFWHGEAGWSSSDSKTIDFYDYLKNRILQPERSVLHESGFMHATTNSGERIKVNRFNVLTRLSQTYYVDMCSRAIDSRLGYIRHNQQRIIGKVIDNNEDSPPDFLPSSVQGSKRHLAVLARNALTIVSELGEPTAFITLTTNTKWPEIDGHLLQGQTAFERPDIVCPVFHSKLHAFLHNLRHGKYFDGAKPIYLMHVIEYQHRGLPHAHVAVKLSNAPPKEDEQATFEYIDKHFSTCCVRSLPGQPKSLMEQHMQHKCSIAVNGCKKDAFARCKYGYQTMHVCKTSLNEKGKPIYKREHSKDLMTVPYNLEILEDWRGHVNSEFSRSARGCMYLFNYLFKGYSKTAVKMKTIERNEVGNDIDLYLKGRFISSMDAVWRFFGYQTYPAPNPPVVLIKAKLPGAVAEDENEGKVSDLIIYFNRPAVLRPFKYSELYTKYIRYSRACLPVSFHALQPSDHDVQEPNFDPLHHYFQIAVDGCAKEHFLCTLSKTESRIVRMEMVYPTQGEIFYLRLLLTSRPLHGFQHALTSPAGDILNSFEEAAISHACVADRAEAESCFRDGAVFMDASNLRGLLASMMICGFPTLFLFNDPVYQEKLCNDYLESCNQQEAVNKLLQSLERKLQASGMKLIDFGYPQAQPSGTELERYHLRFDQLEQRSKYEALCLACPNNPEQSHAEDYIWNAIQRFQRRQATNSEFIIVLGPGGTGKTLLMQKLHARCRGNGIIIQCCASTSLAALMAEAGTTAHSLFNFPVIEDQDIDESTRPECRLLDKPERLELLQNTKAIFWDEFCSNHREVFEAVQRALKVPILYIMSGDFWQILPVIKFGSAADIKSACIPASEHWDYFQILTLKTNMRLSGLAAAISDQITMEERLKIQSQLSYNDTLLSVAKNIESENCILIEHGEDGYTKRAALPLLQYILDSNYKEGIQWLYPGLLFDPVLAMHNVILCTNNKAVDIWNQRIQDLNVENEPIQLHSKDQFSEVDDPHSILGQILTEDVLNSFNKTQVPMHALVFKVNDVCIVLRNLPALKLATNTRVRIVRIFNYLIVARTLNEPRERVVGIPRIRFKFRSFNGNSFEITRTQFPLRLAYAMTINKSQSQTLGKVLLDATEPSFSHGHTYVALSRIRDVNNIRILIGAQDLYEHNGNKVPTLMNIVYPDMISL